MRNFMFVVLGFALGVAFCYLYPEVVASQVHRSTAAVEAYRGAE